MNINELQKYKEGLENQVLILIRQCQNIDAKLDEKELLLEAKTKEVDVRYNRELKISQAPLTKKLDELQSQINEKEEVKAILIKEIEEKKVKLVGLKKNILIWLGYYNRTIKQVEIEKKILSKTDSYSKKRSKEIDDNIGKENQKLEDIKLAKKDFISGLNKRELSLNTRSENIELAEKEVEKDRRSVEVNKEGLKTFEKVLKKDRKELDALAISLSLLENQVTTDLGKAKVEFKTAQNNREETEKNLARSANLVKNNRLKRQRLLQKEEVVKRDKKELKKAQQRILDDRKRLKSDRASLKSVIYQFNRTKS